MRSPAAGSSRVLADQPVQHGAASSGTGRTATLSSLSCTTPGRTRNRRSCPHRHCGRPSPGRPRPRPSCTRRRVPGSFDDRHRARVPDREAFAGPAGQQQRPTGRAVEAGVAGQDGRWSRRSAPSFSGARITTGRRPSPCRRSRWPRPRARAPTLIEPGTEALAGRAQVGAVKVSPRRADRAVTVVDRPARQLHVGRCGPLRGQVRRSRPGVLGDSQQLAQVEPGVTRHGGAAARPAPTISSRVRTPSRARCRRTSSAISVRYVITCSARPVNLTRDPPAGWRCRRGSVEVALARHVAADRHQTAVPNPYSSAPSSAATMTSRARAGRRRCAGSHPSRVRCAPGPAVSRQGQAPRGCRVLDLGERLAPVPPSSRRRAYNRLTLWRPRRDVPTPASATSLTPTGRAGWPPQVVNQLRQVLDRVDVVVGRRRDQAAGRERGAAVRSGP